MIWLDGQGAGRGDWRGFFRDEPADGDSAENASDDIRGDACFFFVEEFWRLFHQSLGTTVAGFVGNVELMALGAEVAIEIEER